MTAPIIIAGTDTGVGKTVFAAALTGALGAAYWKPVQAGLDVETDSEAVRRLAGPALGQILPEAYRLRLPASPQLAAEREGLEIDSQRLALPPRPRPLVVEMAGGLMVPLNRKVLNLDLLARWRAPIVLCARTTLGTINHSLLSIAALRQAECPIHGIAFIGDKNEDSEATIAERGRVRRLGRLDLIPLLTPASLRIAFLAGFVVQDFTAAGGT
jgi:dethiobiotin synthetase